MAPPSSPTRKSKPAGADIRAFFGGGSSQGAAKVTKPVAPMKSSGSSAEVIEIDNDEEIPASRSKPLKRKKPAVMVSSDDEEDEKKITPPRKKAAPAPRTSITGESKEKASTSAEKKSTAKPRPSSSKAPEKPKTTSKKTPQKRSARDEDYKEDSDDSDDEVELKPKESEKKMPVKPRASTSKATNGASKKEPRKSTIQDDDYEDEGIDDDNKNKSKGKGKETDKKPAIQENSSKPNWAAIKAAKLAGPSAPGTKAIPDGEPNCLAGLSFVFTGELSSFAREEAVDLAKRFGGRVTGQPSSVTSYVVLGEEAGPAKLRAIAKHKLKTLSEDEFLNMIATRKGFVDEKTKAKMEKEEKKIREAAREMEMAERKSDKKAVRSGGSSKPSDSSSQLWTVRYAPQSIKEICGNKTQVEKLQGWLHDWSTSLKSSFKKPGKNGMNIYRAVLVTGPPGIGKTTSAHLCAKLEGFTPIELNASDARSKKLVESSTNINNTSLDGWMGGGKATNAAGIEITDKTCLIMDEVDGMSAGDRGGVGALNALIKKTRIPIICIANDRNAQKLKPLVSSTFNLSFRKPEAAAIRSRILTIAFKEKMKIPANVVDQLVQGAQSDIRQVVNMLSTWKLSSDTMDFDEGKNLAKLNEKYSVMTPFNVISKLLGPYLFSPTARETLGDKMELYFHDHSFVPLFVQENYLKTEPSKVRNLSGPEKALEQLRLMDRAASSISDGDLVDALIHGPEQHWSLMPLHAITSTVRPASSIYGPGSGYGGPNAMSFPQWLGQNSKQGKLQRQLGDVQIRMRLKVSGDKPEIRQYYVPSLVPLIVKPLVDVGASAVEDVIGQMDEYFLTKEEWDTIVELGLDQNKDEFVLKKISTATKAAFTKKYNAAEHPVPFHKAQEFGKPAKKLGGGPAPDNEDVFDLEDDVDEEPETKGDEDFDDISKDKMIKQAKAKGKGKAKK